MSDTPSQPEKDVDVTEAWRATQDQKSAAKRLRIFAGLSWLVAIGAEVAAIVLLLQGRFDEGNLPLLIGLLVGIAVFAIAGSLMWKRANRHDPAKKADKARFFFQNQLGAIITVIAFLPLLVLIFLDKDMDKKNKQIAGAVGAVLAVIATAFGISYDPPSVEEYTVDMNECADQIRNGLPTTSCSPEVAEQAKEIARDTEAVKEATRGAQSPDGRDLVFWITPPEGSERHDSPRVFHLCEDVSPLRDKPITQGTVTEAYSQNVIRLTKQIPMEQNQCGFETADAN